MDRTFLTRDEWLQQKADERAEIVAAWKSGLPASQVAKELGYTKTRVITALRYERDKELGGS